MTEVGQVSKPKIEGFTPIPDSGIRVFLQRPGHRMPRAYFDHIPADGCYRIADALRSAATRSHNAYRKERARQAKLWGVSQQTIGRVQVHYLKRPVIYWNHQDNSGATDSKGHHL